MSKISAISEIGLGFLLVFLGILFLVGFGLDLLDVVTDAIFIIFGIIFLRRGYNSWTIAIPASSSNFSKPGAEKGKSKNNRSKDSKKSRS